MDGRIGFCSIHASKQEAVLRKAEVVIRIRPMRIEAIKADYPVSNMADTALEAPSSEALIEAPKHSFAFSSWYRHSRHSSKRRLSIMGHVSHVESRALASASPPGRKATDLLHIVNRSVARLDGLRKRRKVTLRYAQLSVAYCEPSLTQSNRTEPCWHGKLPGQHGFGSARVHTTR